MSNQVSHTNNFTSVLDQDVFPNSDATALIEAATDERVTYGDLSERVARAGSVLLEHGIEPGDRICLFFPNELSYLYAFFGAMRIGAVPVPVNVKLSQELITFVVADSDASVIVTSDEHSVRESALAAARADETDVRCCLVAAEESTGADTSADVDDAALDCEVRSFTTAMAGAATSLEPAAVGPDDPAMQPYTSGSTGRPKGVVLTHGGIAWNTDAIAKAWLLDEHQRGIAATPLYHKNAMPGLKALLDSGGSVVIMRGFEADEVLQAVDEYGITFITGVPAMYKLLLAEAETATYDLSSLEFAICGSAPVSKELHERFTAQFDAPLLEAYGLTEGGPVVSLSPRWGINKVGSTGPAIPGTETLVVDPDTDEVLDPDEIGELLVSNPGVGRYHNRPAENERSFLELDGRTFLRTGDLATKDEDGYHSIVGRVDNMMIVGGENVYPTAVEDLLLGHEAVRDVAVVAAPHSIKGEAPVAFVVTDDHVTEDELKAYAIDRGPAYAHPRRVFFTDELPLTGTEKIDRRRLAEEATAEIDEPL